MITDSGRKQPLIGRERVLKALNHETTDRVAVDLGGTPCSGAHVSVIANLRRALGLDNGGEPVKVVEPYQMLGEMAGDLREVLGIDVVNLPGSKTMFGFANTTWKRWRTFDGTDCLVPGDFNTEPEPNGDILMYPEGDKSAAPSGRMPRADTISIQLFAKSPSTTPNSTRPKSLFRARTSLFPSDSTTTAKPESTGESGRYVR